MFFAIVLFWMNLRPRPSPHTLQNSPVCLRVGEFLAVCPDEGMESVSNLCSSVTLKPDEDPSSPFWISQVAYDTWSDEEDTVMLHMYELSNACEAFEVLKSA